MLRRVSMPLLLCFDSLMHTRSVTITAHQLNKTQPAISRDLARLRELLKDPLFVVIHRRLEPTERAYALHAHVHAALHGLEQALAEDLVFNPAELNGIINIGAAAHTELLLAAPLTAALQAAAPELLVRFQPVHGDFSPDDMDAGRLDLAIGLFYDLPSRFPSQLLFEDERVCVVSAHHPWADRERVSFEDLGTMQWLAFSHMYGKPSNFDRVLQGTPYRMHFSAYISNFGQAPYFLMETQYATTMPRSIAQKHCQYFDLRLLRLPEPLQALKMLMVWSERNDKDRLNMWLRQQVQAAIV